MTQLGSRSMKSPSLAWLVGLLLLVTAPIAISQTGDDPPAGEPFEVTITSPAPGLALFGEVEFAVEVFPPGSAARIELYVDHQLVGELTDTPAGLMTDIGQDNREHTFEVKAYSPSGALAEAMLVSPSIEVNEEVVSELQQLYVTVTRDDSRVLDLTESDFAIIDDGTREDTVTFARGDVRLTAALMIDSSTSMQGDRLRYALRGASAFVQGLRPEDDAMLLLFSDRLIHATPFSNETAVLSAGLGSVSAGGGTALNDHLYMALKRLEHQQGRRVIVLLSDGIDSHSALRMSEVTWLARRSRALIYWLRTAPRTEARKSRSSAWKSPTAYRAEYDELASTVLETGGRIVTLLRIQDADQAFREIMSELRDQYVLGYYPTESRGDGSWHRVVVRVRQSGLQVRTRGGYVDY